MAEQDIFAGDTPVEITRRWMAEAEAAEVNDANAMALASVDGDGLPNVRIVLLKEIEDDGFVFYTNYESAKSQELFQSGQGAFVLHWKSLRRQIRVRGRIEKEDGAQADAYYGSRPLDSRLGAWASRQSEHLPSRQVLIDRVEEMRDRLGGNPPRPEFWGGIRLVPVEVEFWADGDFRLHNRFRWTRQGSSDVWESARLYP